MSDDDRIRPVAPHPGTAYEPTGEPLGAGVGAGAWADRADRPDLTLEGEPKIQPMSLLEDFEVAKRDPDPRGMVVFGADGVRVGKVSDLWVDRSEPTVRYLAVHLDGEEADTVLLPIGYARIDGRLGRVRVQAIYAHQFREVPRPSADDRITLLEEDQIVAYYAGGYRYADPSRSEPFL